MSTLTFLAEQLGVKYRIFIRMVNEALTKQRIECFAYDSAISRIEVSPGSREIRRRRVELSTNCRPLTFDPRSASSPLCAHLFTFNFNARDL